MAEQKEYTKIEEKIKGILSGDAQKNALDFVAFLRENNISLDYNAGESESRAIWNGAVGGIVGNSIGYITVNGDENCPGPWTFWLNSCDFEGSNSADDDFKNAIWAFASPCGRCNENWEKCMGSGKKTILGKEFENQCHSPLMFCNPDAKTLENMKKFLLYLKPEIDGIQAETERGQNGNAAPKIEDAIVGLPDGELRENAMKFAAYLNENELTPNMSAWGKFTYNGYNLGHMWIEDNNWMFEIFDYLHFGDFSDEDEEFAKAVHDHVNICSAPCHDECWRAKDVKIFGKEFKSVCSQHSRAFVNPDGKTIEHIKKLIGYSKKTTPYVQQYHPNNL